MEQTYTFSVTQPVHMVWEALMDPQLATKWLTGLVKIEHEEGPKGQVNSRNIYHYLRNGRTSEATETILQRKDFELLRTGFDHPLFHMMMAYNLAQDGDHTDVAFSYDLKVKNFWLRLFYPLLQKSIKREIENDHLKFKALVEAQAE